LKNENQNYVLRQHTLKAGYLSYVSSLRNMSRDVNHSILAKVRPNIEALTGGAADGGGQDGK